MAKNGLIISVGRKTGYTIYGQGREGKYPMVSLPKDQSFPTGTKVRFLRAEIPGSVTLEAGDLVIRTIKGT